MVYLKRFFTIFLLLTIRSLRDEVFDTVFATKESYRQVEEHTYVLWQ
jgi:hypothetical protein